MTVSTTQRAVLVWTYSTGERGLGCYLCVFYALVLLGKAKKDLRSWDSPS